MEFFKTLWDRLYAKHKEGLMYLVFGGVATVMNIVLFWLFDIFTPLDELVNNVICWIICVAFQYITNRFWVFEKGWQGIKNFFVQGGKFFSGRLFTLLVEELMLLVGVKLLDINSLLVKIIANVVVIILNYIISKVWVFRDGRQEKRNG